RGGWIESRVEQVARRDVAERLQHGVLDARMLALELHQETLGALALEAEIAARRTTAADDRQLALFRVRARFVFPYVHQRPDDDVRAVVGYEPGGHGLERAGEEEIQEERLDEVVGVMAERDLGRAGLLRDSIQHAAPEPRAERTRRVTVVEDVFDELADAGVLDAVLPAAGRARARDQVVLVFLVARVDVDGDERERHRRALAH